MIEREPSGFIDFSPNISRRKFLGFAAGIGGIYAAGRIAGPIVEQEYDEWLSGMSNSEFIKDYAQPISKIHLGASFSPEKFGVRLGPHGKVVGPTDLAMEGFRYAVDDLNLKHIRLGLMWENAVDDSGDIDLSVYQPFIDYGLEKGVRFCKNFGYKSLRWPEQHPPSRVNADAMLAYGSTVGVNTPIGQEALVYTDNMATYLSREYGHAIPMIQPENEPFQKYGIYDQDLGLQYMETSINIINSAFPHAQVLVNAGGGENVKKLTPFITELTRKKPHLAGLVVSGIDVHLDNPKMNGLWKALGLDTVTVDELENGDIYSQHRKAARENGIPMEISEAQIESYGSEQSPLYSVKKLRKILIRCFDILDVKKDDPVSDLRLWGVEDQFLVVKNQGLTPETRRRIELIQMIASRQAA